jgi:carboxyl-terminal processing protease
MKSKLRIPTLLILVILLLGLGLTGGVALDRSILLNVDPNSNIPAGADANFGLMAEAWNTIQRVYVDRTAIQPTQLTYGAISGMVDSLGDTGHSTFLTPQMLKSEQDFTKGEFEGIGAEVQSKNGHVVIVAPIDGSPAQKAGLKPGDIIEKVNGKSTAGLPLDQVVSQVLGPAGTQVTITILDPQTDQTRQVTLTRAKIEINNVSWQMLPGTTIAHLRVAAFSQGVTQDLQKTLEDIKGQNATAIVLDLRNDPGGLLSEAIGVASQFLSTGNVLLEKNAQGGIAPVPIDNGGLAPDIPLVVLINQGTASAAEIVSGALQDQKRAKLVGEVTFGTGTVLNEFPLSDGSALLLATEEWLTPDGRTIWHTGITPDISISLPANVIPLVPQTERDMSPSQLQSSGDTQLLRAIDLLNQRSGAGG